MEKAIKFLPDDLKGTLYRHSEMSKEIIQELIERHFLFRGGDKMQAASGYHQYWPIGRGIFLSHDQKFLMWINEGDHLRVISMEEGGDIKAVFKRFSRAVNSMEEALKQASELENVFL